MENYLCTTCGNQFKESSEPPAHCPVCEDERQYVNWKGQRWATMAEIGNSYSNTVRQLEPKLYGISIEPEFAIGQRALLVRSQQGNVLWDALPLVDGSATGFIDELGGLNAIALSHPHFYGAAVEWSKAFGGIPIYIHEADRKWVMRPAAEICFWNGEHFKLWEEITIIHCGGHFPGSCVLHYPQGANGKGAIFGSDTLQVCMDRSFVSFMYSFPNFIPLSEKKVMYIYNALKDLSFDRIYGGWFDRNIQTEGKQAFEKSVQRYLQAIRN